MSKLKKSERLKKLQGAENLSDVANLLGFTPKGLSYILYKMDDSKKYRKFMISKKFGGTRTIHAPCEELSLLQKRLADLLYDCVELRKSDNTRFWSASHGFHKGRTIVSNARMHKRRRFVFNLDLENFFGTINFGRVRGFFIKDAMFNLDSKVATIVAQIACHENKLPQGSPCSPVISNLIGNILDSKLITLARDARCTYTRYADDLTFSTNKKDFPFEIAVNLDDKGWDIGEKLEEAIKKLGFFINPTKTRMSLRQSRQTVTGLVVNDKVNINQDYYRATRAMCNSVFEYGKYHDPDDDLKSKTNELKALDGRLSYIYFVKAQRDRKPEEINKLAEEDGEFKPPEKTKNLYEKFLFYKYFVASKTPLIVTEGTTDIIYLKCALKSLAKDFPQLIKDDDEKFVRLINFLRKSDTSRNVLGIHNGAGGMNSFISNYKKNIARYKSQPMEHPVIILCDNDQGGKGVFTESNKISSATINAKSDESFYHLVKNLYLVKIPGNGAIESLFPATLLAETLNGNAFNPSNGDNNSGTYGKVAFAKFVVQAKAKPEDFLGFKELLERIEGIINDYQSKLAVDSNAKTP